MYLVKAGAVKCCCFFEKPAYSGPDCPSCGAAVLLYCLCLPTGAYFLQQVTKQYEELRQQDHYGDAHTMDNILLLLVYLYNFKVGSSWLLFFSPLLTCIVHSGGFVGFMRIKTWCNENVYFRWGMYVCVL